MPEQEIHNTTSFTCPFCGLEAGLLSDNLDGEEHVFGVIHALPPCSVFLSLNGNQYCEAVMHVNQRRN